MSEDLDFKHSTILHTLRSMASCSSFSESKTFFLSSSTDVYKVLYPVICKRHKCRLFLNLKQMGHAGQGDKIIIQTTGKLLNCLETMVKDEEGSGLITGDFNLDPIQHKSGLVKKVADCIHRLGTNRIGKEHPFAYLCKLHPKLFFELSGPF